MKFLNSIILSLTLLTLSTSVWAEESTSSFTSLKVGDSLRLASHCESDLNVIKLYVGENFLQDKSLVLLNLTFKNPVIGIDAIQAVEGELSINEELEAFEYILTHEGNIIAKLSLKDEGGVPTRLVGKLDIEGFPVDCK